jgi:hypothetical protein
MSKDEALERLELIQKEMNEAKKLADVYSSLGPILEQQNRSISSFLDSQKKVNLLNRENKNLSQLIKQGNEEIEKIQKSLVNLTDEEARKSEEILQNLNKKIEVYEKTKLLNQVQVDQLEKNGSLLKAGLNDLKSQLEYWVRQEFSIRSIWTYLQQIDSAIRTTQLNLGVSGEKASMMREQFQAAINPVQNLGVDAKELMELQMGITDMTGKATAFRKDDLIAMAQVIKGTGMQSAEAAKLFGTMENYGLSVESSRDLIEDSVNSTAKLGLSSNAVLKKLGANIEKLSNYRFDKGVKGILEMSQASEKFRISMEGALGAADKFRTLDGLLEAGAQLRVLGGEFAKMDEFKLSFLARNKPQEFLVEISKLTKGMATFNKTTGEFDVTDVDYDRLRAAAESANIPLKDLVDSAKKVSQLEFAKKQILIGTDKEKEMLANLATFKPGSTMGYIKVEGQEVALNRLTESQKSLLMQQEKTLKQRGEDSQNFNERFNNTIMQLKSTLVPLLELINKGLEFFNKTMDRFRDSTGAISALGAIVPIGGLFFGTLGISAVFALLKGIAGLVGSGIGKLFSALGVGSGGGLNAAQTLASGKSSMYSLYGIAAAAMGVGIGLYFAAKGASSLAQAFKGLTGGEMVGVGVSLGILGAAMAGIVYLAPAVGAASAPLLAFGAAVGLIGAAIGGAAWGISKLVEAFNTENINFTGLEKLGNVDLKNLDKFSVLKSFTETDVKRMNDMFDVINKINSIDTSKLSSLENLFTKSTLKVQLEGNPTINNNITVEVDGEKFYKNVRKIVKIEGNKGTSVT